MAYCPECLEEYAEGSVECVDCHVPLKSGAPPARDDETPEPNLELVTIHTFSGPTAALDSELAKNVLAGDGIQCVLTGEGSAEILPGVDLVLMGVRKEDAERAKEVLESYFDDPPDFPAEAEEDRN